MQTCRFLLRALLLAAVLLVTATAAETAKSYDLPAGPADQMLKEFSEISGYETLFAADVVRGMKTNAVQGKLTAREAIDALLAGTGLTAAQDAKTGAFAVRKGESPNAPRVVTRAEVHHPKPAGKNEEILTLERMEVTVNVQKRPQSSQEVPIAMTSLGYGELDRFKIESLRDLARLAPNVLVSAFNNTSPTIAIRGANNTFNQIGVNKPVAVVVDDVFVPRNSAATFELFDLDSVQILRGPQGTLFGRNVTGGAIVLNTRQPVLGESEAAMSVEFGNYGNQRYQGLVSGPLGGNVAGSLTVTRHTREGYGRDRLTGREQDDLDSLNVRGQLLFQLKPDLKALLRADYSDDRNGGRTLSSKGVGNDGNRRTSELGYAQYFARITRGASAHLDWHTDSGDFASITAYRESKSGETFSGTGVSYAFLTGGSQSTSRDTDHPGTFSQEFRYASPRWDKGDFVAGVYYMDEDAHRNLQLFGYAAGSGATVVNQHIDQKVATQSIAAYVDGTWRLAKTLGLTVGGRYTTDNKDAMIVRVDNRVPANSYVANGLSHRWSEFTPRTVLTWTPADAVNFYGSVTRGFTSGGYNTEGATAAIAAQPFSPETVTNYEVGMKMEFLEKRLQTNLAAFHSKYADKQELYFNTVTRVLTILNASEATMQGVEAEFLIRPSSRLSVRVAYGYLDATYDSFVVPGVLNNTGNPLGSAPRHKVSAGVDYQRSVGRLGTLAATASYAWTDDYYTGATKDPNLFVPGYSLVNASLRFDSANGRWRASLWGKNLADTEYLLTPSTQGVLAEYLGEPRTYGVTLTWRY